MVSLVHALNCLIATDPAATAAGKITPAAWNAEHQLLVAANFTILANDAGANTEVQELTLSQAFDMVGSGTSPPQGTLLFRSAAAWVALNPGAAGTFLQSQGVGLDLVWGTAPPPGNNSITNALLAQGAANSVKGNATNNTANETDIPIVNGQVLATVNNVTGSQTVTSVLDTALGNGQGQVIFRSSSAWETLAVGSANQALISGGAGQDLSWGFPIAAPGAISSIVSAGITGSVSPGGTAPGSSLSVVTTNGAAATGMSLSGTWQSLTGCSGGNASLWQRVS